MIAKIVAFFISPFFVLFLRMTGFKYFKLFTIKKYFSVYPDVKGRNLVWVQIEGVVVIFFFMLLNFLPDFLVRGLSSLLGIILYIFFSSFKKIIHQNLIIAFNDRYKEEERKTVAFRSFRHSIDSIIWLLYISKLTKKEVLRLSKVNGFHHVEKSLKKNKGLILCAPHYSRFLFPAFYCSLGKDFDTNGIIRKMDNPLIGETALFILNNLGVKIMLRNHWALKHCISALKKNEIVFLLMDQNVAVGGRFVPFFGVPASTFRGVSYLYEKTNCEIICCHASFYQGYYETNYSAPLSEQIKKDELSTIKAIHQYFEEAISSRPYQHLWFHPRWKKRPSGEPSMYPKVKNLAKL